MEASPAIRKYGIAGLSMLGAGGVALGASGGEAKASSRPPLEMTITRGQMQPTSRDRLVNSLSR